jgi:hypothetical protein
VETAELEVEVALTGLAEFPLTVPSALESVVDVAVGVEVEFEFVVDAESELEGELAVVVGFDPVAGAVLEAAPLLVSAAL